MAELSKDTMPANRPRGWWYPWLIVVGLGIVVIVNAVMYALAVSTFSGVLMDSDDGAERLSIASFAAARESRELGWRVDLDYARLESGRLRLTADLSDADGAALSGLHVTAVIWRPTHEGVDRAATLTETGPGRYGADVDIPLAGQWDVRLSANRGADIFERSWRIHAE